MTSHVRVWCTEGLSAVSRWDGIGLPYRIVDPLCRACFHTDVWIRCAERESRTLPVQGVASLYICVTAVLTGKIREGLYTSRSTEGSIASNERGVGRLPEEGSWMLRFYL